MMKNVSILGSTGSIGRQSLDVIEKLGNVRVLALTAGTSVELMAEQCRQFQPELAVMATKEAADALARSVQTVRAVASFSEEVAVSDLVSRSEHLWPPFPMVWSSFTTAT